MNLKPQETRSDTGSAGAIEGTERGLIFNRSQDQGRTTVPAGRRYHRHVSVGQTARDDHIELIHPGIDEARKHDLAGDIVEQDCRREEQRRRRGYYRTADRGRSGNTKTSAEQHDGLARSGWRAVISTRVVGPTTVLFA